MKNFKLIKKRKEVAFGKMVYLLGVLDGKKIWLEKQSWDCGWYWGFGYIEMYTNNDHPSQSKDIISHSHYDSLVFNNANDILSDLDGLTECTLTESEQWKLSDLMKSFYTLKKAAEFFYSGNSNYTNFGIKLKDLELYNKINKDILPRIFEEVEKLLDH